MEIPLPNMHSIQMQDASFKLALCCKNSASINKVSSIAPEGTPKSRERKAECSCSVLENPKNVSYQNAYPVSE